MASVAKPKERPRVDDEDEQDDESESIAQPDAPGRGRRLIPAIIGGVVLLAVLAGGISWYFLRTPDHAHKHEGADIASAEPAIETEATSGDVPALYLDLAPAFVVNLADDEAIRFLQVEVELMARDSKAIDAAKDHMPLIRNALLMLFAQQHAHDLASVQAKEKLRQDALAEVQRALREEKVPSEIEAVYFTAFVMQ